MTDHTAPEPEYQVGAAYWITFGLAERRIMFRVKDGWAFTPGGNPWRLDHDPKFTVGEQLLAAPWPDDEARRNVLRTYPTRLQTYSQVQVWYRSLADAIREQGGEK